MGTIAYGESPYSFSPKHDMSLKEAEELFDKYFKNKPRIKEFIDETHEQVERDGFVTCMHGHRRNLRNVFSDQNSKRNESKRQSVNTIIQGSGAYLTNLSVVKIDELIRKHNLRSRLILTVHDSVVVDAPKEEIPLMARIMKYTMENLPVDWLFVEHKGETIRYPITADVEIGANYNDMVEYSEQDFLTFQSPQQYCKYYYSLAHLKNWKETQLGKIDKSLPEEEQEQLKQPIEQQYEQMKAQFEQQKHLYQNFTETT